MSLLRTRGAGGDSERPATPTPFRLCRQEGKNAGAGALALLALVV